MEYVLSKFKLKKGKTERAREFLVELHRDHQKEMAAALDEARMTLDCSYIDGDFLFIFKRIEDHRLLKEILASSQSPFYDEIRSWAAEIIESSEEIPVLAAFDRTPGK